MPNELQWKWKRKKSDERYVALRVMQEVALTFLVCQRGARVGLVIVEARATYYSALNAPNHLPSQ
jgi:hypothetical protein